MSFMVLPKGVDAEVKDTLTSMFKEACESDEYQKFAAGRNFASPANTGGGLEGIVDETYKGLKEAYDSYFVK